MKLPQEIRESLVIAIDDYFETENDDPDAASLAEACLRLIEVAAEDADFETDDLVVDIETDAELEEGLHDALEFEFAKNDELELTGEDVVVAIEKVGGLTWTDDGMEEELDSLDGYPDEDDF
ncbi:MAG: hypothetical protein GY913_10810 [Proteobacteria bacterium]|nr:hypothetical protein [Pseudomonadota bacterium]MCP4917403.1 hypothetical protein [Pseudomonadota bacterium]